MTDAVTPATRTRRGELVAGARATLPLILGAIPFGIVFGALGTNAGLSAEGTLGMSLFVFAGSAQFVATGLVAEGAGVVLIVLTTFIVNLRHALYSASLAPHMKHLPHRWLLPLGFWLTDESYAVVIQRYNESDTNPHKHWFFLGSALAMYGNWQLCTMIGILAGRNEAIQSLGLDFAMVVTFIGIVVPLLVTRPMLLSALAAGLSALLFNGLPHQLGLIVAAVAGIAVGYAAETLVIRIRAEERRQGG